MAWFNGGLFDDDTALPLEREEIETALRAAALDWSEIDPSILGTLFERGLDPDKRSQLGAHYTDRDKIMRIVDPVIVRPLLAEWETAKVGDRGHRSNAPKQQDRRSVQTRLRRQADRELRTFLERLRGFTVLDPACGSGNFLYLALHALKDIEHRVQLEAEELGLASRVSRRLGPANVKGIEINAYAAELARVAVWIGEIQWMRRNGFGASTDPILDPLDTIECRDAILAPDGTGPDWPVADVVIGNPPFLGGKLLIGGLGEELRRADVCRVEEPRTARGRSRLLLVREGGRANRSGQGDTRRPSCDQLNSRRCEPPGPAGCDRRSLDLRHLVRRAVGDRRYGGAGVAGLLLRRG